MTNIHIYCRNYQKFNVHWKSQETEKVFPIFQMYLIIKPIIQGIPPEQCPQLALNKAAI